MGKLLNFQIMKNKQDKFYSLQIKLDYNIHVNIYFYIAIVQLLANSLSKVDIELRNTLYN